MAQIGSLAARAGLLLSLAAGAHAETDSYVADVKASGSYRAGEQGAVEVSLSPKGAYHINPEYPYKFKADDPPPDGVTYPKPVLTRADGTFDANRATFKLPFVAARRGTFAVGGTLHLSVCSDANCVLDRVPLQVDVDVK